jgi:hypothetical protein
LAIASLETVCCFELRLMPTDIARRMPRNGAIALKVASSPAFAGLGPIGPSSLPVRSERDWNRGVKP